MKGIEINIQLDPVEDGASWIPKDMKVKGEGALIIGTNGKNRIAEEDEALEILDRIATVCASDFMGNTPYLAIYNSNKVLHAGTGRYLVGSAIIVKGTCKGIAFLNEAEIEDAKKEFESRLVTLCGGGIQFSAYELG